LTQARLYSITRSTYKTVKRQEAALNAEKAMSMLKSDLITDISNQARQLSEKDITLVVNFFIEWMTDALANGNRIEIRDFGSFNLHHRLPRNAHNPKTGEKVTTIAKYSPHFKPGKKLRELVDASRHNSHSNDDNSQQSDMVRSSDNDDYQDDDNSGRRSSEAWD